MYIVSFFELYFATQTSRSLPTERANLIIQLCVAIDTNRMPTMNVNIHLVIVITNSTFNHMIQPSKQRNLILKRTILWSFA